MALPLFLMRLLVQTGIARWLPAFQQWTDGGSALLPYYSQRLLAGLASQPQELLALRQPQTADIIDLATATPHFDLVPSASTKLPADRRGWPPPAGLPELQAAVAEWVRAVYGCQVKATDEVLITAGVSGAWQMVLDALLNRGDRVVLFDPCSPLYRFALRQRRLQVCWVPTTVENGQLRYDAGRLVAALRGARLIVVNTPSNPTGGMFRAEDYERIAWWAERLDVLIFHDTVFDSYCYERENLAFTAWPRAQQRTLTAGSISTSHALAAARVGWLTGHRHLLRPCLLTAVLQSLAVPTLCQQIAVTALRLGTEALRPYRADFDSRRHYAFERLQALGLRPVWPDGGFFLWVPIGELGLPAQQFARQLLRVKKVLVWPGHHFGPSGVDYVRISYAAEDGRLRQGLTRLGDFVRQWKASGAAQVKKWAA